MNNPRATWDPTSGMTLVAGDAGGRGIELWGWDGDAWQQLDDGHGPAPSARDDIQLVADPARGVVWLHGGRSGTGTTRPPLSDTWQWDGERWTQLLADGSSAAPPARTHPVTAWDPSSERLVLYGGIDESDTFLADTWAFDGQAWQQLHVTGPSGRWAAAAMAWDPVRGALAMLAVDLDAPDESSLYAARLWYLDEAGWQLEPGDGPRFSPIQPLVAARDRLVFVDGGGLQGSLRTWSWDGDAWEPATEGGPAPRNGQALAYDAERDRVVMFGGYDGSRDVADLWEWDGAAWSEIEQP